MAAWYTVLESKISWAPIGTVITKKGQEKPRFSRIGVRIDMADGSWWFCSDKHGSWTLHFPRRPETDFMGRPMMEEGKPKLLPEKTSRWASTEALVADFGPRSPGLVAALKTAYIAALEAADNE